MMILNDLEATNPLRDTWGFKRGKDIYWYMEPDFDFSSLSTQDVNAWFARSLACTINTFSEIVRLARVEFVTDYTRTEGVEPVSFSWEYEVSQREYLEEALDKIHNYQAPIERLTFDVDMFVYARTQESPVEPVQIWVRGLASFTFYGGPEHGDPGLILNLNETLFCFNDEERGSNERLYVLNHPLLSKSLQGWEKEFNSAIIPDGPEGIYKYGFLPD